MMILRSASAWFLALSMTVSLTSAGVLGRMDRFATLHDEAVSAPRAPSSAYPDLQGLELHLKDGRLVVTATRVDLNAATVAHGFRFETTLPLGPGYFQAPVEGTLRAFVSGAVVTIDRIDLTILGRTLSVRDVRLVCEGETFRMEGRSLTSFEAVGRLRLLPEQHVVVAEVEKVKAGFLPVPRRAVFAILERLAQVPGVEFERPSIYVRVGEFLR